MSLNQLKTRKFSPNIFIFIIYKNLDFNNSLPAFGHKDTGSSSSYMIYGLLNQTSHFELRFRFMTTDANQNNSLILFLGNTNNIKLKGRPTDFLSLSLLDDMVVYQINMGQGRKLISNLDYLYFQILFISHF